MNRKWIFSWVIVALVGCASEQTIEESFVAPVAEAEAPTLVAPGEALVNAAKDFSLSGEDLTRMLKVSPKGKRVVAVSLESGRRVSCGQSDCKYPLEFDGEVSDGKFAGSSVLVLTRECLENLSAAIAKAKATRQDILVQDPLSPFRCSATECRPDVRKK